jgi:hypothetical protein
MAYCTNTDIKVYVGTTVSDADLTAMITDADRVISAFFASREMTVDTNTAKTASILLTRAAVAERFYITGENPTSYSSGDFSQSGAADQLALSKELRAEAFRVLNEYILLQNTDDTDLDRTRCDAVMDDLKFDQNTVPSFGGS